MNRADFPFSEVSELTSQLIEAVYLGHRFRPESEQAIPEIQPDGIGVEGLELLFAQLVRESAGLATSMSCGHMDTAPHPVGVYADALVSALNNNLLFRELSPFASRVEEKMLDYLCTVLGLDTDWHGVFTSGGSLANLTALFAATGGYQPTVCRTKVAIFTPPASHASIQRAAAVLGIPAGNIVTTVGDEIGRTNPEQLRAALAESVFEHKIIVGVLGSTVHGAVESVEVLSHIAREYNAWLHVDAVYGGAIGFSRYHRHLLRGLNDADSVAAGPQKWMYVPRLSAVTYVRGKARFDDALHNAMSYSMQSESHRGHWGLQGSRRADAVVLWAVLCCLGSNRMAHTIDHTIALTEEFYKMLLCCEHLQPSHKPDLNVQCFGFTDRRDIRDVHNNLGSLDVPWVSVSQWENTPVFRSVLLAPELTRNTLQGLCDALS